MARFRRKPTEVEAIQLRWSTWNEVCDFVGDLISPSNTAWVISADQASDTCGEEEGGSFIAIRLPTVHDAGLPSQDWTLFRHGDWIVPDSQPGTFYPVKPNVFAATYEPVD